MQEHHLQRALSAQQVYGTAEALVIPIPDMDVVGERYLKLYGSKPDFRAPKQYIHVQRESGSIAVDVFIGGESGAELSSATSDLSDV